MPKPRTSEAGGQELAVAFSYWNREIKTVVARKPADPNAEFACRVLVSALVAGPLALAGMGAFASVVGGAILFKDKLPDAVGRLVAAVKPGQPSG